MNTFFKRAGSGLVAAFFVISAILFSKFTFILLLLVAVVGGIAEFYNIAKSQIGEDIALRNKKSALKAAVGLVLVSFILWGGLGGIINSTNMYLMIIGKLFARVYPNVDVFVFFPVVVFSFFVRELYTKKEKPFQNIGWNVLALVYIVLPVLLLNKLYFEKGCLFVLMLLFMIWFYDSMCYIWGALIGKRKLFERVSPKKTVEGFIGGMITTLILVFFYKEIAAYLFTLNPDWRLQTPDFDKWQWLIVGFVTLIFATWGDLVESLLKRSVNVKDSGNIMPGHGGFLDRLDAIILAIPFSVFAVWLVEEMKNLSLIINYINN